MERLQSEKEIAQRIANLNMVLIGLPGSGKSTLVDNLGDSANINYIYLGGITRTELNNDTELSRDLKSLFQTNEPWPDEFVMSILEPHILESQDGFVLDGIPRKESEAGTLVKWLDENDVDIDLVVVLDVEQDIAMSRIGARDNIRRLEKEGHYETRFAKWKQDRPAILETLSEKADIFSINTNLYNERQVAEQVYNYVAVNFMGS